MLVVLAALLTFPTTGIGSPFPEATTVVAPYIHTATGSKNQQKECFVSYKLKTDKSLISVAQFYREQATKNGALLVSDRSDKSINSRLMLFGEPKFMFIDLDRNADYTTIGVTYKTTFSCG